MRAAKPAAVVAALVACLSALTAPQETSADTDDHAVAADLMQASAVTASAVYHAANRAERLPRRQTPAAPGRR